MSLRAWCPACDGETSTLKSAFDHGEPCPYCGLSADAAAYILDLREHGAEALTLEHLAKAERRAERAEAAEREVRGRLNQIRQLVTAETTFVIEENH